MGNSQRTTESKMTTQAKAVQPLQITAQGSSTKTQAVKQRAPRPFAIRTDVRAGEQCDYKTCYDACRAAGHDDYDCQFYCDEECG